MQLDDTAGCPGSFSATKGATRPFCFNCDRYHRQTASMLQPAAMLVDGQWHCVNRRSGGGHGEVDCAAADSAATPCNVGAPQAAGYVRQGMEGEA